jgi:hypothetical protein
MIIVERTCRMIYRRNEAIVFISDCPGVYKNRSRFRGYLIPFASRD